MNESLDHHAQQRGRIADPPAYRNTGDETGAGPNRESTAVYPGTPRWVKVFGISLVVVVLLVIIVMIAVGGGHGPGRHIPSGGAGGHTAPIAHAVPQP
jgi:hypothetical protein